MLYQRVRPKTFDGMIGNDSVIASLRRMVEQKDHPHTFLFSGPTGCGKTTLARIVAKEVGCKEESMIELNAANTRGIDTSREISSSAGLSSIYGGKKAYILDESQQLTKPAMQALLKVIEDVPSHCYFFFCTTDPGNLLPALRNRCTEFQVYSLKQDEIFELLVDVVTKLNIAAKKFIFSSMSSYDEVLALISESCDGCPRKALVLLEKVCSIKDVDKALDLITSESSRSNSILDLYKALSMYPHLRVKKYKEILTIYNLIEDEPERIRLALLKLFMRYLGERCEDEKSARDTANLIEIFSQSTFYGGKAQLGALVVRAIFNNSD